MLEPFTLPFMQRAFIGGALVALLAGYFGPFIVQRRMAFLGSGLAHAAFGGVALGILLGAQPVWVAIPFTVIVAIGIVWVRDQTDLAADTSIGIFFAVAMALGIVFLSMRDSYAADAFTYLFGSVLAITWADVAAMGAVCVAALASLPWWPRWAYATFDPVLARSDQLHVKRDDYALTIALAVAVVVAIKVVGIVLMAAFIVLPAATARLVSRNFAGMAVWSIGIGVVTAVAGLYASYFLDMPSGPVIILVQAGLFGAAGMGRRLVSQG